MTTMKKLLEMNTASGQRRVAQVFRDFCELSALALRNTADRHESDGREARYRTVAADYSADEMDRFAEVLAQLVVTLDSGLSDVLGHLYMSLELGNERLGQFFTPYDVSLFVAKMSVGDMVDRLREQEFITVYEPACGSGGMVIATVQALHDAGFNYQTTMHVTAEDIDITAVHMIFIHLAVLHIPALVVHGNSLTREQRDVWPTPAHVIGRWDRKLRRTGIPGCMIGVATIDGHDSNRVTLGVDSSDDAEEED